VAKPQWHGQTQQKAICMGIPAHLWLKDDGGADIKGSSTVQGREQSIEVIGFGHGLSLPIDLHAGKITGVRSHSPLVIEKGVRRGEPLFI